MTNAIYPSIFVTKKATTPPKSGPPIPGSNPRSYYTLEQARIGGIRSGDARRFAARNRHAEVRRLHRGGKSQTAIARLTGYSQATVSRILSGIIKTCLNLIESIAITPIRVIREQTLVQRDLKAKRRFNNFRWRKGKKQSTARLKQTPSPPLDSVEGCLWCGLPKYADAAICPYCGVWVFCIPEKATRPELKGDANTGGCT